MARNNDPRGRNRDAPGPHVVLLAIGLVVLGVASLLWLESRRSTPRPEVLDLVDALRAQWVDAPAPQLDLPRLGGGRLSLGELDDQVVLIHFWASWCPTCTPELPLFAELKRRFGPRLRILHVSLDESPDNARQALPAGFDMDVLLDPEGGVARSFGTEKLPEAYLVDGRGRVLVRFVANQPWLEPRMLRLLDYLTG